MVPSQPQNLIKASVGAGHLSDMVAVDSEAKSAHAEKFVLPATAPVKSASVMKSRLIEFAAHMPTCLAP